MASDRILSFAKVGLGERPWKELADGDGAWDEVLGRGDCDGEDEGDGVPIENEVGKESSAKSVPAGVQKADSRSIFQGSATGLLTISTWLWTKS